MRRSEGFIPILESPALERVVSRSELILRLLKGVLFSIPRKYLQLKRKGGESSELKDDSPPFLSFRLLQRQEEYGVLTRLRLAE